MKPATLRLAAAVILFAAWIGWLAYLVYNREQGMVLSRPQFLVSTLDVIADVDDDEEKRARPQVTIRAVHWPKGESERLAGKQLMVADLPQLGEKQGWQGPGRYILALQKVKGSYQVARIPPSPGYPARTTQEELARKTHRAVGILAAQGYSTAGAPLAGMVHSLAAVELAQDYFGADPRRIYPATPAALKQLDTIRKASGAD